MKFSFPTAKFGIFPVFLFCLAGATLIGGPARAQTACTQDPEAFIQDLGNQVVEILSDLSDDREERKAVLRGLFMEHIAIDTVAPLVLGRYWRDATEADRADYMEVFPVYFANLYSGQLIDLSGTSVNVLGGEPFGVADVLVEAEFVLPDANPFPARFRVRCIDGDYRLLDALISGISLVQTKRDEFGAFLRRNSLRDLIDALSARI